MCNKQIWNHSSQHWTTQKKLRFQMKGMFIGPQTSKWKKIPSFFALDVLSFFGKGSQLLFPYTQLSHNLAFYFFSPSFMLVTMFFRNIFKIISGWRHQTRSCHNLKLLSPREAPRNVVFFTTIANLHEIQI
jgi:hypothetical protein